MRDDAGAAERRILMLVSPLPPNRADNWLRFKRC
jgi:hypothetical protein